MSIEVHVLHTTFSYKNGVYLPNYICEHHEPHEVAPPWLFLATINPASLPRLGIAPLILGENEPHGKNQLWFNEVVVFHRSGIVWPILINASDDCSNLVGRCHFDGFRLSERPRTSHVMVVRLYLHRMRGLVISI
jgi:hypothetical protein